MSESLNITKLFLRKILIKVLQPFGFYITYYASARRVYSSLSEQSTLIQEYELKRIFDAIKIAKNHKFYNDLLFVFTPNWKLNINKAKFIGFGAGASSLSTFRRVEIDEKILHEKIYFSSHQDLKRILWFYKNAVHLVLNSGIAVPEIYEIYTGDVLTVIYSDFVSLIKLDVLSKEENLVQFSKQLYQFSLTGVFQAINKRVPSDFKDFKHHFEYKRNRSIAMDLLGEHGISLEAMEQTIMQNRYVLTHGDIQDTNAFKNNVLIDWDSVGIYPAGFDPAFLLFYLILDGDLKEDCDILNWITTYYKKSVKDNEWESFQLSVLFFLFVFIQVRLRKEKRDIINRKLIVLLKNNKLTVL